MHLNLIEHVRWKKLDHVLPDTHCQVFSCAARQKTGGMLEKMCVQVTDFSYCSLQTSQGESEAYSGPTLTKTGYLITLSGLFLTFCCSHLNLCPWLTSGPRCGLLLGFSSFTSRFNVLWVVRCSILCKC